MTDPGYPILERHNPACSSCNPPTSGLVCSSQGFFFPHSPPRLTHPRSVLLCYDTPGSIHLAQHLLPPKAAVISPPPLLLVPPDWSSFVLSCSPNNIFPMQLREGSSFVKKKESQLLSLTEFLNCLPKAPRIKFKLITTSQLHPNWSLLSSQASLPIIPPPPQFYVALSLTFFLEHSSLVSASLQLTSLS